MPRPRFTVRWLMVAVFAAALALTMAVAVMSNRRTRYLGFASAYALQERVASPGMTRIVRLKRPDGDLILRVEERKRSYYALMRAKYERAARYPWLLVAPDPPEPE